jgi:hypothetical protein
MLGLGTILIAEALVFFAIFGTDPNNKFAIEIISGSEEEEIDRAISYLDQNQHQILEDFLEVIFFF